MRIEQAYWPPAPAPGGRDLIVFVPGWGRPANYYHLLLTGFQTQPGLPFSNSDILTLDYPVRWFSNADPNEVARQMEQVIQVEFQKGYTQIYLVGHSIGGLLLRRALLEGYSAASPWTGAVKSLVLLASGNRGYVLRRFRDR